MLLEFEGVAQGLLLHVVETPDLENPLLEIDVGDHCRAVPGVESGAPAVPDVLPDRDVVGFQWFVWHISPP